MEEGESMVSKPQKLETLYIGLDLYAMFAPICELTQTRPQLVQISGTHTMIQRPQTTLSIF